MADELAQAPGRAAGRGDSGGPRRLRSAGRRRPHRRGASSGSRRARRGSIRETTPANWGEFLRIRGLVHEQAGPAAAAHHDFAQSANVFELLGERYQAALSQLALGRLAAAAGIARGRRALPRLRRPRCSRRSARERDLDEVARPRATARRRRRRRRRRSSPPTPTKRIVRRLVDAAIFPELLARETATALLETTEADAVGRLRRVARRRAARRRQRRLRRRRRARAGARGRIRAAASTATGCC